MFEFTPYKLNIHFLFEHLFEDTFVQACGLDAVKGVVVVVIFAVVTTCTTASMINILNLNSKCVYNQFNCVSVLFLKIFSSHFAFTNKS